MISPLKESARVVMDLVGGFLFCCLSILSVSAYQEGQSKLSVISEILLKMQHMQGQLTRQENTIDSLRETVETQGTAIESLRNTIKAQNSEIIANFSSLQNILKKHQQSQKRYTYESFGCYGDVLNLACPGGRRIEVTNAVYGMYGDSCPECCTPHGDDCTEHVSENSLEEWIILKATCDNQTNCTYQYTGALINECQAEYSADYLRVYYDCLPEAENDPIGFTAYTSTDTTREYVDGDTILFDEVLSNFGGFYNHPESIFTCPYYGIYMFNVGFNSCYGDHMLVGIYVDDINLIEIWANGESSSSQAHASGLVITLCHAGQVVSLRATFESCMYCNQRRGQFSGYMLHRI